MIWYLIRHAESTANAQKVWAGRGDCELSPRGREDLTHMRESGRLPRGDFFVSSPLLRCLESLRLLYGREPDLVVPEFAECDFGEWTGLPYMNLSTDPRLLQWLEKPDVAAPDGESLNAFRKRVIRGCAKTLLASQGKNEVVLLLHGDVIRVLMNFLVDASRAHQEWKIPNNGGYVLFFEKGHVRYEERFCRG